MNEQQGMMGSGLTRYRSAPSSCFASLLEGPNSGEGFGSDDFERLFNPRASSPETQRIFSRFMNSGESIQEPVKIEPKLQSNNYSNDKRVVNNNLVAQKKIEGCSNMDITNLGLIRHSSSPAGLFTNIDIDEFGSMGNFGDGNIANAEATRRFKTPKMMDPITEINSWDEIDQKNEGGNRLSHHLSLPKSFTELSGMGMEKLLQDSVPCKIRAKRGCATHPRSIAERVRRTKISERMRKLQELVPNMDKQTNTSDMLDLAVEYIKELQGQLKMLSDDRENCSCEAKLG